MSEKLFHVGVKALITNSEGKILLLLADVSKHKSNVDPYWDIPGGRIQQGADLESTLEREVLEEIGVDELVSASFLTALISKHEIPVGDGSLVGLVLMVFTVVIADDSDIKLSEEHTAYEWVEPDEAKARLSNKYPQEFTDRL